MIKESPRTLSWGGQGQILSPGGLAREFHHRNHSAPWPLNLGKAQCLACRCSRKAPPSPPPSLPHPPTSCSQEWAGPRNSALEFLRHLKSTQLDHFALNHFSALFCCRFGFSHFLFLDQKHSRIASKANLLILCSWAPGEPLCSAKLPVPVSQGARLPGFYLHAWVLTPSPWPAS